MTLILKLCLLCHINLAPDAGTQRFASPLLIVSNETVKFFMHLR
jgi:hypothetical protein